MIWWVNSQKFSLFFLLKARRTLFFALAGLIANAFESASSAPQPAKSIRLAIAMGVFGGCNMLHAIWVIATTGREKKAMSDAWQKRAERIRNGNDDLFACNSPATQLQSDSSALKADVADVDQVGPERGDGKYEWRKWQRWRYVCSLNFWFRTRSTYKHRHRLDCNDRISADWRQNQEEHDYEDTKVEWVFFFLVRMFRIQVKGTLWICTISNVPTLLHYTIQVWRCAHISTAGY